MKEESYEVNVRTCAIIPVDASTSKVIETDDIIIVNKPVQ